LLISINSQVNRNSEKNKNEKQGPLKQNRIQIRLKQILFFSTHLKH